MCAIDLRDHASTPGPGARPPARRMSRSRRTWRSRDGPSQRLPPSRGAGARRGCLRRGRRPRPPPRAGRPRCRRARRRHARRRPRRRRSGSRASPPRAARRVRERVLARTGWWRPAVAFHLTPAAAQAAMKRARSAGSGMASGTTPPVRTFAPAPRAFTTARSASRSPSRGTSTKASSPAGRASRAPAASSGLTALSSTASTTARPALDALNAVTRAESPWTSAPTSALSRQGSPARGSGRCASPDRESSASRAAGSTKRPSIHASGERRHRAYSATASSIDSAGRREETGVVHETGQERRGGGHSCGSSHDVW